MFAQKLLPALAVFSVAAAQTASICSQATATINSQADAAQYTSCSTITGDVLIGPGAAGSIALDGPQQITGDLKCHSAGALTGLTSTSIGTIGGAFDLFNLTFLANLQMSDLTSVHNITWDSLTALSSLSMTSTISKASVVSISNTFLSSLQGINLMSVDSMNINNNNRLTEFDTQVGNITDSLIINANGKALKVSLPNLIWAGNITLRTIASISIPSLAVVNGSFGLYESFVPSLAAPNLTAVGDTSTLIGGLAVDTNIQMTNMSIPGLKTVGGAFQIANNTLLSAIDFPALTFVGGAIDFAGNFTTPLLADLNNVKGGFNVQSAQSIDCSAFDAEKGNIIQGSYSCMTTADPKTKSGSSGSNGASGTSGSSGNSTDKGGAASSFGVSAAVAGLGLVGTMMQMVL